jgi:hypothetical protein
MIFVVILWPVLSILFALLLVGGICSVYGESLYFGHSINLSDNNGASESANQAAVGNNVYVVWQDNSTGNDEIYFVRSSDNGERFGESLNLSNDSGNSQLPELAATGSNVYVVWQDNSTGNDEIYFMRSNNSGQTFEEPLILSNDFGKSESPQVVAAGNNVYVVWQDNSTENDKIYFIRSIDSGQEFAKPLNLSKDSGNSKLPELAATGSNVYVVWQGNSTGNDEIYFKASLKNGVNFRATKNLSNDTGKSGSPHLAAAGNNVYVVWQDNSTGNDEIYFKASLKKGVTFRAAKNLSNDSAKSESPQLIASGNDTLVFWVRNDGTDSEILYKTGTASFFRGEQNISSLDKVAYPKLSIDGNNLFAVWESHSNTNDSKHIVALPFSFSSRSAFVISNFSGYSVNPVVTTLGSNAYVIWQDQSIPKGDIFFKRISSDFFERNNK